MNPKKLLTTRKGAVLPFFALLLPMIFLLCGLAINTAHLQLLRTEMKVSTDAAAHAGGRGMSIYQTTEDAVYWAEYVASQNQVGGQPLVLDEANVLFGFSNRTGNGQGRYVFEEKNRTDVDRGTEQANSIRVIGHRDIPLAIRAIPNVSSVDVSAGATATQVDRDIAIVLDRSGSMLEYKDTDELEDEIRHDYYNYRIGYWEAVDAIRGPYRTFSWNVLQNLSGDMYEYAYDVRYRWWNAPRHSRWHQLDEAVNAFLDVLDDTDQEELVSVATFSSSARLDQSLTLDYEPIRTMVSSTDPSGSTAIGQGIQEAVPSIMTASSARPFAAKTIVILTDGINNRNPDPVTVTEQLMEQYNITIHTVTFTDGADQTKMYNVAQAGFGTHYHADDGDELIDIFETIANNLPTILSE